LLRVAGTITDVACNASTSEQGMVNTLTSRRLQAKRQRSPTQNKFCSSETLNHIDLMLWSTNSHALLGVEKQGFRL